MKDFVAEGSYCTYFHILPSSMSNIAKVGWVSNFAKTQKRVLLVREVITQEEYREQRGMGPLVHVRRPDLGGWSRKLMGEESPLCKVSRFRAGYVLCCVVASAAIDRVQRGTLNLIRYNAKAKA